MLQIVARELDPISWWRNGELVTYRNFEGLFVEPGVSGICSSHFGIYRPTYGTHHTGSDHAYPEGTRTIWTGDDHDTEVVFAGAAFGVGYGNTLVLRVNDDEGVDWLVLIAHFRDRPLPEIGSKVRRGQLLGYVGMTGTATGPHHHIQIAKALDYDRSPQESEDGQILEFGEFWNSPRDDDRAVSRLHDVLDFLVDADTAPEGPLFVPLPEVGATLTTTTRPVDMGTLEGVCHAEGVGTLVTWASGQIQTYPVGAPDFVWAALGAQYPDGIMPAGEPLLLEVQS